MGKGEMYSPWERGQLYIARGLEEIKMRKPEKTKAKDARSEEGETEDP
jgi:hypothetical protein